MPPTRIASVLMTLSTLITLGACNGETGSGAPDIPTQNQPIGTDDTVQVYNSASGPVAARLASAGQSITLTFTSSDGNPITQFQVTSDLGALPAGWSAQSSTLACASVTTGSGCLLNLTYAPTADASGTLTLKFGYTNNAGVSKTGSVTIPYSATANNNIVSSVSPAGTVNAVAGVGGQAVAVTFTTDDGNPAADLAVTTDLNGLPAGWSSGSSNFNCASVNTGNGCQLALTFSPIAALSGTLALNYSYIDNSGAHKTGALNIPYASTVHNTVTGSVTPSGQVTANTAGGNQSVTVTFTTSDGNAASSLQMNLSVLAAGWNSSSTSFTCSSISSGSSCQLTLTYAPTTSGGGTLSLPYTYSDNSGASQTGTLNIPYLAQTSRLYMTLNPQVTYCDIHADGSLGNCAGTTSTAGGYWSLAFAGDYVYLANNVNNIVASCSVVGDGSFSNCSTVASGFNAPWNISINGGYLYVPSFYNLNDLQACALGTNGTLGNCAAGTYLGSNQIGEVAFKNSVAYVSDEGNSGTPGLQTCSVSSTDGSLSSCTAVSGVTGNQGVQRFGNSLYFLSSNLQVCPINSDGSVGTCVTQQVLVGANTSTATTFNRLAILNGHAYVPYEIFDMNGFPPTFVSGLAICTVNQDGTLALPCTDSGVVTSTPTSVTVH